MIDGRVEAGTGAARFSGLGKNGFEALELTVEEVIHAVNEVVEEPEVPGDDGVIEGEDDFGEAGADLEVFEDAEDFDVAAIGAEEGLGGVAAGNLNEFHIGAEAAWEPEYEVRPPLLGGEHGEIDVDELPPVIRQPGEPRPGRLPQRG